MQFVVRNNSLVYYYRDIRITTRHPDHLFIYIGFSNRDNNIFLSVGDV